MPAKRHHFGGPLNELDYARAIDPLSRSGAAIASFIKGIALTSGLVVVGSIATAVAYAYYKPERHVKVRQPASKTKEQYDRQPDTNTKEQGVRNLKMQVALEDRVKVGILGTGWGVTVQLPQFRKAGLEVTAIFSRGQQRARQLAEQNGITHSFSSAEDLCLCEDVDVVSVVTPPYLHCKHFSAALAAGKHVICDKPMALNGEEAEQMVEAARQHPDQVAIVDHELRFTPMLQLASEHLQAGQIGQVRWVDIRLTLPAPSGGRKWDWWADEAQGGGVVGAFGSHVIDTLRFILQAEVGSVSAHLRTMASLLPDRADSEIKEATSEDYASLQMTLQPQAAASSGIWGADHPASPPYRQPHDHRMPQIEAHVTMCLVAQAKACMQYVIGADLGAAELDVMTGSLSITNHQKQVIASHRGHTSAFQEGERLLGAAVQQALGPNQDKSVLQHAATITDGLAVQYVIDAVRASSKQQGSAIQPKHIDSEPWH